MSCELCWILFQVESSEAFIVSHIRVKWLHQLAYALRLRIWRKQDYHHRSVNDAKNAIQARSTRPMGCGLSKEIQIQLLYKQVVKRKNHTCFNPIHLLSTLTFDGYLSGAPLHWRCSSSHSLWIQYLEKALSQLWISQAVGRSSDVLPEDLSSNLWRDT